MYRFASENGGQQRLGRQEFDEFRGQLFVVDLADIDGHSEEFQGRAWLENRVREKLPMGWDLEWQPDRTKESDNPIALMQFADESTALLLRTHRTRNWLPTAVLKALLSDSCTKVGVGWDGPDKLKMQSTFNFLPQGIYDLSEVAKKKGLGEQGLKTLTEHFGLKMRKDPRVARSNWASPFLTQEQVYYAAEDAYFSYLLYDKLRNLPDKSASEVDGYNHLNQGVLQLEPGWEEQGIERRHDGLYCSLCEKGPMTVPQIVARHMEGQKHKKKMEQKCPTCVPEELSDEYLLQGIVAGDDTNDIRVGEYKCMICNAGPFNALQTVDQHLKSKKHIKNTTPAPEPSPAEEEDAKRDLIEEQMWNMPDYVELEGTTLTCTLCNSRATAVAPMRLHLGGDKHAKKCRSSGHDELIYVQERSRLEIMSSGKPVMRKVAKKTQAPRDAEKPAPKPSEPAQGPLPDGWTEHIDPTSTRPYYHNPTTGVSQWVRPQSGPRLPPGWEKVALKPEGCYYADVETQVSQWEEPPAYVHGDWRRNVDPVGQAFWTCSHLQVSFYESDTAWTRLIDQKGSVYWSNTERGIRFFEKPP
mmetsp:Transcript_97900/g.227007  ORF Transcript_97900/g.227007 Transcript_97900/m.227007 type:complete len:584 (-) Transcript_97900:47-1798(-)